MVTIYAHNGTLLRDIDVNDDSCRTAELMGYDMLMLRFTLTESVTFPLRCYSDFENRRYRLFKAPEVTKRDERQFEYVMQMYTDEFLLHTTMLRNSVDYRLKFPYTATPREHLEMICANLNLTDGEGGWAVDYSKTLGMEQDANGAYTGRDGQKYADRGEMKTVSFEFAYCIDAISSVAQAFGTEYEVETWVERDVVKKYLSLHLVEYNKATPLEMRYGRDKGFVSGIVRRNDSDIPPVDRLYIQGGEQNIPEHYGQTATVNGDTTTWSGERSNTLLLPKNAACFYHGGAFFFSQNPTVRHTSDGTPYILAKDYRELETNRPIYEVLYNDKGENIGTTLLMVPTPCFLVSSDGRSLQRVRHTYYDPDYSPRATKVEAVYDASEIYPMRVGGVNAVRKVNTNGVQLTQSQINSGAEVYYDICDIDSPDLTNLGVPGETMTVIFQDGMLAGREFEIQTVGEGVNVRPNVSQKTIYNSSNEAVQAWCIPLCQSDHDGVVMPKEPFIPAAGDHYVVFHCQLPDEYVHGIAYGAEYRALREMTDWLYRHGADTYTFTGTVDGKWAKRHWTDVEPYMALGQHVKAMDAQLFGYRGLVMRVTGIRQYLGNPHAPELTLSNAVVLKFNWTKHLSKTVEEMRVRPRNVRPNPYVFPRFDPASRVYRLSDEEIRGVRLVSVARVSELESKRVTDRNKINEMISTLYSANEVFLSIKSEFNKLRSTLLARQLINQKTDAEYVNELGLQHCTINPKTGIGECVSSPASIGIPDLITDQP